MYAKNRIPLYEGDGFIHASPARGHQQPAPTQAANAAPGPEQGARGQKRKTLRDLLGRALAWMGQHYPGRSALEDYLSRSSNLADLERRMREAERDGRFLPG